MRLCASTSWFSYLSLDDVLRYVGGLGIRDVELTTGGLLSNTHCKPDDLLADPSLLARFKETLARHDATVWNFKSHGNLLHPDETQATRYRKVFEDSIVLASKLNIPCVTNFSGCPGDNTGGKTPNWVIHHYPDYFRKLHEWQWNEVVIPYWQKAVKFAAELGVKVAIEMHPGFNVYNPETLLRLRAAVGSNLCCCFDPAHLFWLDIDPCVAIRALGSAICHFHAKDVTVDMVNVRLNGRLDPKPMSDSTNRAWLFRTVGWGHDALVWKNIITALTHIGYDGPVSLEQDDSTMTATEGFEKSVEFLKSILITEKSTGGWWERH